MSDVIEYFPEDLKTGPVQWYGGKGRLTSWLRPLVPRTRIYCEPYGGAGSLMFSRAPVDVEVYNDLDGFLVNFMRVLQHEELFEAVRGKLSATLFSLDEFRRAIQLLDEGQTPDLDEDPDVDLAWAFFVNQNQGMSGIPQTTEGHWSRSFQGHDGMSQNTHTWWSRVERVAKFHRRVRGVQIDHRDALEVIKYWDTPETTFYVDPPYVGETRAESSKNIYRVESPLEHHWALVETLIDVQGSVVLSGYEHTVYERLEGLGWHIDRFNTQASAAVRSRISGLQGDGAALEKSPRTEVVWRNKQALEMTQPTLFEEG